MFSEQDKELIYGFLQFAFNEMKTEDWTTRRRLMIEQFNTNPYDMYRDDSEKPIFDLMIQQLGSVDNALYDFFCKEITHCGWFDSYCFKEHPELDTRQIDDDNFRWIYEDMINNWLWYTDHMIENKYVGLSEMLRDVLGLDFNLE